MWLSAVSDPMVAGYEWVLTDRVCNGEVYPRHKVGQGEQSYECGVNIIVDLIVHGTLLADNYDYHNVVNCDRSPEFTAYGRGSCSQELPQDDCLDCMQAAHDQLFSECTHSVGSKVQLNHCGMRYEKYDFPSVS
ncbi:hypothetical protein MLD38_029489 [Melastoma candidum]|uniref:Uncharacterized protein n=1 Tax=Melastoma candidum TaxID=119954 RepID=A0ACB9N848_9MYRT|nr:hypothetical protein MLD38_029489 [Melastoma candidum]